MDSGRGYSYKKFQGDPDNPVIAEPGKALCAQLGWIEGQIVKCISEGQLTAPYSSSKIGLEGNILFPADSFANLVIGHIVEPANHGKGFCIENPFSPAVETIPEFPCKIKAIGIYAIYL
jgi:hypothetical protein